MIAVKLPKEFFLKMALLIKVLLHLFFGPVLGELQSHHCSDCWWRKGELTAQHWSTPGVKQRNSNDGIWREFSKILLIQRRPVSHRPWRKRKAVFYREDKHLNSAVSFKDFTAKQNYMVLSHSSLLYNRPLITNTHTN